jgi:hypothetical protein
MMVQMLPVLEVANLTIYDERFASESRLNRPSEVEAKLLERHVIDVTQVQPLSFQRPIPYITTDRRTSLLVA